jgi:hypothetical protein
MIPGNVAALSEPPMTGIVPQQSIVPNGPTLIMIRETFLHDTVS